MEDNKCISCGVIIPEGRQVCPNCETENYVVISQKEYDALKTIEKYHIKSCGKDSVVLSKEEAERFRGQTINIKKVKLQERKETAEKILKFFANAFPKEKGISSSHVKIHRAIEEISKKLKLK